MRKKWLVRKKKFAKLLKQGVDRATAKELTRARVGYALVKGDDGKMGAVILHPKRFKNPNYKNLMKLDEGKVDMTGVKNMGIIVAVKHASHPVVQLSLRDLRTVEDVILNEVTQSFWTKPKFSDIKRGEGILELTCADRATAQWLKGLELQLHSENAKIVVEEDKEQLPRKLLVGYFPYGKTCPEERIFELIDLQNRGIYTSSWLIVSQEPLENVMMKLEISVDHECLERLQQTGFSVHFGLEKVALNEVAPKHKDSFQEDLKQEEEFDDFIPDENYSFKTWSECSGGSDEETEEQGPESNKYSNSVPNVPSTSWVHGSSSGILSEPGCSSRPGPSKSVPFDRFSGQVVETPATSGKWQDTSGHSFERRSPSPSRHSRDRFESYSRSRSRRSRSPQSRRYPEGASYDEHRSARSRSPRSRESDDRYTSSSFDGRRSPDRYGGSSHYSWKSSSFDRNRYGGSSRYTWKSESYSRSRGRGSRR